MARNNNGREKRNLPIKTKNTARTIDTIKIKLLTPFAIFLPLAFVNHESKTKIITKIIIPKKIKFIY